MKSIPFSTVCFFLLFYAFLWNKYFIKFQPCFFSVSFCWKKFGGIVIISVDIHICFLGTYWQEYWSWPWFFFTLQAGSGKIQSYKACKFQLIDISVEEHLRSLCYFRSFSSLSSFVLSIEFVLSKEFCAHRNLVNIILMVYFENTFTPFLNI